MQKSEIIFDFLLPAHQKPTRAIEPRMQAFYHPSLGTISRDQLYLLLLLPPTAHMGLIAPRQQLFIDGSGVIADIQTQMLWLLFGWLGLTDDETIERGTQQL